MSYNGFINILKPSGMSSSYAVVGVRKMFEKGTRVGHMGTLDTAAAGVLPVGIGFAARLFDYIIDKEKEYICELSLGIRTDTQDADGRIISREKVNVSREAVLEAMQAFKGDILQTPPAYSAVMKDGRKLYHIAREGGDTTLEKRPAHVEEIELLEQTDDDKYLLRVVCGRGTYIRTICADIGDTLGCGAHCSFLLRTKSGCFTTENAVSLEHVKAGNLDLLPIDLPIMNFKRLDANEKLRKMIKNGAPLPVKRYIRQDEIFEGETVRVYLSDRFVGIANIEDGIVKFKTVMPPEEFDHVQ